MPNIYLFLRNLLCANCCACAEDQDTKALDTKINSLVHLTHVVEFIIMFCSNNIELEPNWKV